MFLPLPGPAPWPTGTPPFSSSRPSCRTAKKKTGYRGAWGELDAVLGALPDRFVGFLSVPLGLGSQETAVVVVQEVVGRGLGGVGELAPPLGGAELVEPVLQAAADLGWLPVVVYGSAPSTAEDLAMLAALGRWYHGVPLVVSQLGGQHWMQALELVGDIPSMYLELSTASIVFAVGVAIKGVPDRILFGSDAPYGDPVLARVLVERVTSPGEVCDRVLGGAIAELVGLG
ncbi:amidohydrolase family protein [Streptomyces sp. NPDC051105]|uniref:amidohydrolase family protein n=1 Tax=Streptomyces sp. NPDC051105 TaxID=3154843 RepID=UPI00342A810C